MALLIAGQFAIGIYLSHIYSLSYITKSEAPPSPRFSRLGCRPLAHHEFRPALRGRIKNSCHDLNGGGIASLALRLSSLCDRSPLNFRRARVPGAPRTLDSTKIVKQILLYSRWLGEREAQTDH